MTTLDCLTELFCRVDDDMPDVPKHPQAHLYPSESVTLAGLCVLPLHHRACDDRYPAGGVL